jgi:hypothetical protein
LPWRKLDPGSVSSPALDVRGGSGRELLPALSGFGDRQAARPLILVGTVTNVAAFGAFVDIGVH